MKRSTSSAAISLVLLALSPASEGGQETIAFADTPSHACDDSSPALGRAATQLEQEVQARFFDAFVARAPGLPDRLAHVSARLASTGQTMVVGVSDPETVRRLPKRKDVVPWVRRRDDQPPPKMPGALSVGLYVGHPSRSKRAVELSVGWHTLGKDDQPPPDSEGQGLDEESGLIVFCAVKRDGNLVFHFLGEDVQ